MKWIEINGITYACKIHQQDKNLPRLLMLHGFMGDHRAFNHLIKDLTEFCNPITADLLGHGQTSQPTNSERYDEKQQLRDICELINMLNIDPLFLFGYSMGGRLALKSALKAPELFRGLILESTNCGISDPEERKERQKLDSAWAADIQDDFDNFLSGWKELDLFQSPLPEDKSLVRKYRQIQSEQSPPALAASLRGFGTGSMTPVCNDLEKLNLPVQLMAGSEDEKYQQISRNLVDQFPNATFSSVRAGHRTHLDNPPKFLSELKNFIINFHYD